LFRTKDEIQPCQTSFGVILIESDASTQPPIFLEIAKLRLKTFKIVPSIDYSTLEKVDSVAF
jgi:hypothetical protein